MEVKDILGLGDRATLPEIKQAFRSYSKNHHPDIVGDSPENRQKMQLATEGYQALVAYCTQFQFPLVLESSELEIDDEDWWMNKFGQDPVWGKPTGKE
jgi:hypothetical protein